jgi:adenylate cyclase 10
MVKGFFIFREIEDEHTHKPFFFVIRLDNQFKVKMKADALLIKNQVSLFQFNEIKQQVLMYIPAALVPYIEIDCEKWSSELRRITILFINLGIDLRDANTNEGLAHIQKVIETVQKCVYMHEGSLNKLLMDDKGSTLIVCFGLPPLMH